MPHFHNENPVEFFIKCITVHRQGFMPMYTACIKMLGLRYVKHIIRDTYLGKSMSLANMDRAITHVIGHAHSEVWICICSISLECIPTLQGQEHPWLGRGCLPNHVCPSYEVHGYLYNIHSMPNISTHRVKNVEKSITRGPNPRKVQEKEL